MDDITAEQQTDHTELTVNIIAAYVTNNRIQPTDLPALIANVHAALGGLGQPSEPAEPKVEKPTPAQIRKSIQPDGIVSFIDGKAYKTLKRHLTKHGLDEMSYRVRYGLPVDYPLVASSYSEKRSALALSLGLGRNAGEPAAAAETEEPAPPPEAPKRGGRRKKVAE